MRKSNVQIMTYVLSDYVLLNIGWFVFALLRFHILSLTQRAGMSWAGHLSSAPVVSGQIIFPLVMLAIYALSGYYNRGNIFFKSRIDELANTAIVTTIGVFFVFFVALINDTLPTRATNYAVMAWLWLLWFVPVYVARFIITGRATRRIRSGDICFNTLVIGTGLGASNLVRKLESSNHASGFNVVGFVSTQPNHVMADNLGRPVFDIDDIAEAVASLAVTRIIVVPHHNGIGHTTSVINGLYGLNCTIYLTPDLYSLIIARPRIGDVVGEPLIDITNPHTPFATRNCKRVADIVLSSLSLVLLSPLYLALAIAVRSTSPGPAFYRQERIGYQRRPFNIIKFRTMNVDAEADGPTLSCIDDPRITRIGHFMRKYRLDELPQFWNVLRGDMSLVGPRPEREYYIRQIVQRAPYFNLVHQVRPGITSWGMVKYGYAVSVDQMIERLRYELIYLENVSVLVDLKILFHTVNTVLTGKGL